MKKARVSAIAAIGRNRELGKGNSLIWRIPEDLKRVKDLTMGHSLIMGRKTFESIGRPLPGRTMIVVSRNITDIPGCVVKNSFEEALSYAHELEDGKEDGEIFIFGGAQLYTAALPVTNRLYLTLVDAEDQKADAYFPEYGEFAKIIDSENRNSQDLTYEHVTLERHT